VIEFVLADLLVKGCVEAALEENKKASSALALLGIGAAVWAVYFLWQQGQMAGWISHDAIAVVTAKGWSIGEYRTCTQPNIAAMKEEPQLDCSSAGAYEEPKRFKVSFQGETYKEELTDKASISWRCQRLDGTDPNFSCDDQKVIQAESTMTQPSQK
jgi:hypothetical protein